MSVEMSILQLIFAATFFSRVIQIYDAPNAYERHRAVEMSFLQLIFPAIFFSRVKL